MGRSQTDLQAELLKLAPRAWLRRPPDNRISYPCFIYRPSKSMFLRADNRLWHRFPCWNIIYITQDPNSDIEVQMMEHFDYCAVDRIYESDDLYHYSFTLYY